MADSDAPTALSDVDEDLDLPTTTPTPSSFLADLDRERTARLAAESSLSDLQNSFTRLKVLAHEAIRKRDEATSLKDDAFKKSDAQKTEIETSAQTLVSGLDRITSKVRSFAPNSASGPLPRSAENQTGLPAVVYGVVERFSRIIEELITRIESVGKERDDARRETEQRNYEVAIEVSELEAKVAEKGLELAVKEERVSELEKEVETVRGLAERSDERAKVLQGKLDEQRLLVIEQLNFISRAHEEIRMIARNADLSASGQSEFFESTFMWKEMDMDENLRTALEGTSSLCELARVAGEKVGERAEERRREVEGLRETVERLVGEKKHIGTLLRSALSSNASEVRQVAEDGLREAGIDFKFNGGKEVEHSVADGEVDEVYTLAGALENTVKASQIEISELQSLVEALRAESSLLKAHLDAQTKEINQQKNQIKELQEKERLANENVEGLMVDIAAAEEEIDRWKAAAEQEAAAGESIEQEFVAEMATLRKELEEAKQSMVELENKIKFKEETAAAAMTARDAAEKSLHLADIRSTRLRERLEELTRQLEESDNRKDSRSQNRPRYVCWPWQWLGLSYVGTQADVEGGSNEMELSEPLI